MPRILLVEDHVQLADLLDKRLSELGCEVLRADRMDQAMDFLRSTEIDLVLTDFHIQQGNGRRLLNEIRKTHEHLPVFLMTGTPNVDESALSALRFDRIFLKPFPLADLIAEVRKVLAR